MGAGSIPLLIGGDQATAINGGDRRNTNLVGSQSSRG